MLPGPFCILSAAGQSVWRNHFAVASHPFVVRSIRFRPYQIVDACFAPVANGG